MCLFSAANNYCVTLGDRSRGRGGKEEGGGMGLCYTTIYSFLEYDSYCLVGMEKKGYIYTYTTLYVANSLLTILGNVAIT